MIPNDVVTYKSTVFKRLFGAQGFSILVNTSCKKCGGRGHLGKVWIKGKPHMEACACMMKVPLNIKYISLPNTIKIHRIMDNKGRVMAKISGSKVIH